MNQVEIYNNSTIIGISKKESNKSLDFIQNNQTRPSLKQISHAVVHFIDK